MLKRPSEVINWFKTQQSQLLQQALTKAAAATNAAAAQPASVPQIIPRKSRFSSALPYTAPV